MAIRSVGEIGRIGGCCIIGGAWNNKEGVSTRCRVLVVGAAGRCQCGCNAGSAAAAVAARASADRAAGAATAAAMGLAAVTRTRHTHGRVEWKWDEGREIMPTDTESTYLDAEEAKEAGKGEDKEGREGATHG